MQLQSHLISVCSWSLQPKGLAELAEWVAVQSADDRADEARAELEAKGLVA